MKFLFHIATISILVSYGVLFAVAYALFWPIPTLELVGYSEKNPIVVDTKVVHPGDSLSYKLDYCKYTDIPSVVHRTLVDGQIITLTDTDGQLPTGCHNVTVKTAVVPETINPGDYYLKVVVAYKVNPFRTIYIRYQTTKFTVVEGVNEYPIGNETILINK